MAINKVVYPTTPVPVSDDWGRIINILQSNNLTMEIPRKIDYNTDDVLEGAVFQIGGAVYLADSDTAITGTPSDYVKITPGTTTATAAYVSSLTGVTWNDTYNGYYDGSGNFYIFDEGKALTEGEISEIHSKYIEHDQDGGISLKVESEYGTNRPLPSRVAFRSAAYNFSYYSGPVINTSCMCWSPELSIFIALSLSSTNVSKSLIGSPWVVSGTITLKQWNSVCWSPGLTLFCAVAEDGSISTSPDGATWTDRTSGTASKLQDVVWSPSLSIFCAVGHSDPGNEDIIYSSDGITWTQVTTSRGYYSIDWSEDIGVFIAGPRITSTTLSYSTDGINWTDYTFDSITHSLKVVKWASAISKFCAMAVDGASFTSSDGITWTEGDEVLGNSVDLAWSNELELFICVTTFANQPIATSVDGVRWTQRSVDASGWTYIEWSPELGIFCILSPTLVGDTNCQLTRRFI